MLRVGLIGLDGEDLPIDLFGGLQPAALMVPDRNRQRFGNGCHGTDYDTMKNLG